MFNFLEDVNLKKEKEKKKKKIYGEELRLQIERNKKRKMEEKNKSREESIRNLKLFQNNQSSKNYNTLNNMDNFEDKYNNYNYNYKFQTLNTPLNNPLINYKTNENYLKLSNKKNIINNYHYSLENNGLRKNISNLYQTTDFNLNNKKNNNFNNYFQYNNYNETKKNNNYRKSNNFLENGIYIMKKSPSSFFNNNPFFNNFNNINTNSNNNLYPQNDDSLNNSNINNFNNTIDFIDDNMSKNNYFNNNYKNHIYNTTNNNNLMNEINLQILFKEFVEQQIKTINNYEANIEDIFFFKYKNNNNYLSINSLLEKEKNQAIQNIKEEQNKLKNKLGFFPMENSYNYKIEQLFNKILNKKIDIYSSIKELDKFTLDCLINKQKIEDIELLRYKSKYEDDNIQDTVPNFQNLDSNSQKTLRGYSKFVKINDNNLKDNKISNNNRINNEVNFLESWRDQLGKEISENKNDTINLRNNKNIKINNYNNNYNIQAKNEYKDNNIKNNTNTKSFPNNKIFNNINNKDIIKKEGNTNISNHLDKNKNNENNTNNYFNNNNDKKNKNIHINENNIEKKDSIIISRKNKSSLNIINSQIISSNDLNVYKKECTSQKNNKIKINFNELFEKAKKGIDKKIENDDKKITQTNLNINYLNKKKDKKSFTFKNTDSSFMKNIKMGLNFTQISNDLKNDDNNNMVSEKDKNNKDEKEGSVKTEDINKNKKLINSQNILKLNDSNGSSNS